MTNDEGRGGRSAAWGVAGLILAAVAIATWQATIAPKSTSPVWPAYAFGAFTIAALYMCFATVWGWWPAGRPSAIPLQGPAEIARGRVEAATLDEAASPTGSGVTDRSRLTINGVIAAGPGDRHEVLAASNVQSIPRLRLDLDPRLLDGLVDPAEYPRWCRKCGLGLRANSKYEKRCENDIACDNRHAIDSIEDRLSAATRMPRTRSVHPRWLIDHYPALAAGGRLEEATAAQAAAAADAAGAETALAGPASAAAVTGGEGPAGGEASDVGLSGEPPVRTAEPESAEGLARRAIDRLSPPMRIILTLASATLTRALRFSTCLLARVAPEIAAGRGQAGGRSWLARCSMGIAGLAYLASAVFAGWVEVAGVHHYGLVEICIAALTVAFAPALFCAAGVTSDDEINNVLGYCGLYIFMYLAFRDWPGHLGWRGFVTSILVSAVPVACVLLFILLPRMVRQRRLTRQAPEIW